MENQPSSVKHDPAARPGLMRFTSPAENGLWPVVRNVVIVFFGFFLLEMASIWLRSRHPGATLPIVPAVGFAFAALLVYSEAAILPIFLAVVIAGFLSPLNDHFMLRIPSLAFGVVLGWMLSRKLFSRKRLEAPLLRPNETLFFFIGGGICAAILSATFLQAGMEFVAGEPPADRFGLWLRSFLGIMGGFVALTPGCYYLLRGDFSTPVKNHRATETILLFAGLAGAIIAAVSAPIPDHLETAALITLPYPFLVWIALRRGLRPTSLGLAILGMATLMFYYLREVPAPGPAIFPDGLFQVQFTLSAISCLVIASQRDAVSALALTTRLAHEAAEFCPWEWGRHSGITFLSSGWTARTGLPAEVSMPLERWIETVHPDDQQEFAEAISRGAFSPTPGFTMRFRSWDVEKQDWYWAKSIGYLIKLDPEGNPLRAVGVVLDIDDIVEAEKMRISAVQNQAELATLRAQLNPHFLFNCLNSIRALIGRDETKAREMVTTLATLLRSLLERRNESFETIQAELAIIQKYLSLEQIRFGSRLQVDIAVDPLALSCHIPCFLILTLVENAIKHGISKCPEGGELIVRIMMQTSSLAIRVINTGHLKESGKGVGLENTRRRVQLMTNNAGAFDIQENPPGRVIASVELPIHTLTAVGEN